MMEIATKMGRSRDKSAKLLGVKAMIQNCLKMLQYNGSNDDLDWRIDFRYPNFICIMKYLRSRLIKGCSIEWMHLHLLNLNLWLDLIKTSFFKVLTIFIRSGEKFYIILRKKISSIGPFLQVSRLCLIKKSYANQFLGKT